MNHAEVVAARHEIVVLVEVLRSERSVAAPGMVLAMRLIDNDGPLLRAGGEAWCAERCPR